MCSHRWFLVLGISSLCLGVSSLRAEPPTLAPERFVAIHKLIKPQPGELRFQEIPWLLSVHDARVQAAALGKPILVWSGSGGAPLGVC